MRPPRRLAAVLAVAAGLALAGGARAQGGGGVAARRLRFAEQGKQLVVSAAFTDLFDEDTLEELDSGFATTIVLRSYVYTKGQEQPVAFAAATVRIVYDLWEEVYLVQINDPRGERNARRATRAEALKEATTLAVFPVASLSQVAIGPIYQVAMIVELNPVSQEMLADVRRWLARPQGRDEVAGNSSFFGSFVSIFVNPKIEEAERTLKFRSQRFYRVKR